MADVENAAPIQVNAATSYDPSLASQQQYDFPHTESGPIYASPDSEKYQSASEKAADLVTMGAPAAAVGMVDSLLSSVGLVDEKRIGDMLKTAMPTFGGYYDRNKTAAQGVGGLIGMFIPGMIAQKAISGTGAIATAAENLGEGSVVGKVLSKVLTSGKSYDELLAATKARSEYLASAGVSDFSTDARLSSLRSWIGMSGPASTPYEVSRLAQLGVENKAGLSPITTLMLDRAKESVAFEIGAYTAFHKNETLYPSDASMADWMTLSAGLSAAFVAPEAVFLNRALGRAVQDVAKTASKAANPMEWRGDILYRDGSRDLGITRNANVISDLEKIRSEAGTDPLYKDRIYSIQRSLKQEIKDQTMKLGGETAAFDIKGLTDKFLPSEAHLATINQALEDNPAAMLGAKAIDTVSSTLSGHIDRTVTRKNDILTVLGVQRDQLIDTIGTKQMELNAQKLPNTPRSLKLQEQLSKAQEDLADTHQQIQDLSSADWFVHDPNQGVILSNEAKPKYNYADGKVYAVRGSITEPPGYYTPEGKNGITGTDLQRQYFTMDGFVTANKPGNKAATFSDLDLYERSAHFNMISKAIDDYRPDMGLNFAISKDDHWTRLDYLQKLEDKFPGTLASKATFPPEWQGTDRISQLQWASLRSKSQDWSKLRDTYESQFNAGVLKIAPERQLTPQDIRYMVNLPDQPLGTTGPIEEMFQAMRAQGDRDIGEVWQSLDDFKQGLQHTNESRFMTPTQYTQTTPQLSGNSFTINKVDGTGEIMKPVLLVKAPMTTVDEGKDAVENALGMVRAQTAAQLAAASRNPGAKFVGAIVDFLQGHGALPTARDVGSLVNGVVGKAIIAQQDFNARSSPVLHAMLQLGQNTDQIASKVTEGMFSQYKPVFSHLLNTNNAGDLMEFNLFTQARQFRWDLKDGANTIVKRDVADKATGQTVSRYGYALDDTKGNRDKLRQYFNEDFKDGMLMPIMTEGNQYRPLLIGQAAHDGASAISDIGSQLLSNNNYLKTILGKNKTNAIPMWTVPIDFTTPNATVGYILRGDGQLKTSIIGRTPAEFQMKRDRLFEMMTPEERGEAQTVMLKDVKANADLHDQVWDNLLDFSDPVAQNGKAIGSSGLRLVDSTTTTLKSSIDNLADKFDQLAARTRTTFFEPEVNRARQMADASGFGSRLDDATQRGEPSIWKQYINAIEGKSDYSARTMVGGLYTRIEGMYDNILNALASRRQSMIDYPKQQDPTSAANLKEYTRISKQLGEFNPFQSVADFVDTRYKGSMPATMRSNMGALNSFTSTAVLGFLEVAQSVTHGLSLGATLPAVLNSVRRIEGEAPEVWRARIGAWGSPITDDVAIPSMTRLATSTLHDYLNNSEFQAAMGRAAEQGYFKDHANDMMKMFGVSGSGFADGILKRGVDAASYLTNKSFEVTRAMAFASGYKLYKEAFGIEREADLFTAARQFANKTVGNYNSTNRPQIFQGAVGMPLGLFQTWAWNYMQRMYEYVENKQYRALATQIGMQAAVFGGRTIPGMEQFLNYFGTSHDYRNNPVDWMNANFGQEMTDVLLNGTIANLPKVFGARDGIAIYQRGDANVRVPATLLDPTRSAPFQVGKTLYGGIQAALSMMGQNGQFSTQQLTEILSHYSVNRPIRHLLELAAGDVTDSTGHLVTTDVYNGMSIASRLLSYKPMIEAKEADMMQRLEVTRHSQEAKLQRLEQSFRGALRGGDINGAQASQAIRQYINDGGNPAELGSFFRNQYLIAKVPRSERALMESFGQPNKLYDTMRLLNSGIPDAVMQNQPVPVQQRAQ